MTDVDDWRLSSGDLYSHLLIISWFLRLYMPGKCYSIYKGLVYLVQHIILLWWSFIFWNYMTSNVHRKARSKTEWFYDVFIYNNVLLTNSQGLHVNHKQAVYACIIYRARISFILRGYQCLTSRLSWLDTPPTCLVSTQLIWRKNSKRFRQNERRVYK